MRRRVSALTLGILGLMTAAGAEAQSMERPRRDEAFETARGLALGTGVRASALSASAVAYNPAALPLARAYHLEGFGGYTTGPKHWTAGATVADSTTNRLAAGLSFRGIVGDGDDSYSGIDGRLALGYPIANAISIGAAVRYLSLSSNAQLPAGTDDELVERFTVDGAVHVQPTEQLRLTALGYNLVDTDSPLAPTLLGGSGAFQVSDQMSFGADMLVDVTTFSKAQLLVGGGAELLVGGQVPLRAGYRFDGGRSLHTLTAGVGYVDKTVGVDLTLSQDVSGDDATEVLAAVRYFVN